MLPAAAAPISGSVLLFTSGRLAESYKCFHTHKKTLTEVTSGWDDEVGRIPYTLRPVLCCLETLQTGFAANEAKINVEWTFDI